MTDRTHARRLVLVSQLVLQFKAWLANLRNGEPRRPMKISLEWGRPLKLRDGTRDNLIYTVSLDKLPKGPGICVFGRRWGKNAEALYVGKANKIRGRVKGQLGLVASLIVAVWYERVSQALLRVIPDEVASAGGQLPNHPPPGFYHLRVWSVRGSWP